VRYPGTIEGLRALASSAGNVVEFEDRGNKQIVRYDDGAVLCWWQSTKTVYVQGPREAADALRVAFEAALPDVSRLIV
jgi:hypothetical protein